jgi:hypothetical protein
MKTRMHAPIAVACTQPHDHRNCDVLLRLPCGHSSRYPYVLLAFLPRTPVFTHRCPQCGQWRIFGLLPEGYVFASPALTQEAAEVIMFLFEADTVIHQGFAAKLARSATHFEEHYRHLILNAPSMGL